MSAKAEVAVNNKIGCLGWIVAIGYTAMLWIGYLISPGMKNYLNDGNGQ